MRSYFSLVVFSHTVFALPFALTGFFLSYRLHGQPQQLAGLLLLVVGCMVFARSAAMAFNRYLDRDIDAINPRTTTREIPAGIIKPRHARLFVVVNCIGFILCAWLINPLCFALSPVALAVVLGYSYTKRFTALCHLVLGAGLGLAPLGAWLAAGGGFEPIPLLLAFAVMTWVAGFDIIYALQDDVFDKQHQLHSIPAYFGRSRALLLSKGLHVVSATLIVIAVWTMHRQYPTLGTLQLIGTAAFLSMLVYQHTQVKLHDLSRINRAFFTANGIASVVFGLLTLTDLFV
jgi:4-hydroxybenzoate polyprenyltransferase